MQLNNRAVSFNFLGVVSQPCACFDVRSLRIPAKSFYRGAYLLKR